MPDHRPPQDPADPKGLIREAFRIDGITEPECRSIFVDWALSVGHENPAELIGTLIDRYSEMPSDHPMHRVLAEGLAPAPKPRRRGGWAARPRKT